MLHEECAVAPSWQRWQPSVTRDERVDRYGLRTRTARAGGGGGGERGGAFPALGNKIVQIRFEIAYPRKKKKKNSLEAFGVVTSVHSTVSMLKGAHLFSKKETFPNFPL